MALAGRYRQRKKMNSVSPAVESLLSPRFPAPRASFRLSLLLSFTGHPNETHVRRSQAVEEGTGAQIETAPTNRRSTRDIGQEFERLIAHHVRSRKAQNQPGAEGAMGEAQGQAEAYDLGRGA
jgi:hypothetical protein